MSDAADEARPDTLAKSAGDEGSQATRKGHAPPDPSPYSDRIFRALDDIAAVVLDLKEDPAYAAQAEQLDRAGSRLIAALIAGFSLKSAQIELLTRELNDLHAAWSRDLEEDAA